jgi:transcriptional regulator with XRE-family HTH domain
MSRTSDRPFGEALRELMAKDGLSFRGLAEAIADLDEKGVTHAHLNMLANGHDKPSMRVMELVAEVCGVRPDYFAEYRLAVAMRELDPTVVGLEQALENLNARLGERRRGAGRERTEQALRARTHPTS